MAGGWFKATKIVCHACTAGRGEGDETVYVVTRDDRTPAQQAEPMRPFKVGETTSEPTPPPSTPVRR